MTFYTLCIVILFFTKHTLSLCVQNYEYMKDNECVPCTKCQTPLIVVATCTEFRDTYCGPPAFRKQSDSPFGDDEFQPRNVESTLKNRHFKDLKKEQKPFRRKKKCEKLKNKHKREMCKKMRLNKNSNPLYKIPTSENMLQHEEINRNYDVRDNILPKDLNITKAITSVNRKNDSIWIKYEVKLSILISIIFLDSMLILVLIFLFYRHCRNNGKKSENRQNGQKLPNPSNTPVKCRFTAVLPSNSPQCLNDSPGSTLLRNHRVQHHESGSMSQYSLTCSRPDYHQTDFIHNYPDSSLSLPRSNHHSTFQPRETASHYAQTPNSYVMDRLLENRNGDGHLPMENNVYVETWCNASSPIPPDSCENVVPFFAGFQAPTNYSSASSPIMLRTYRET